MWPTLHDKGELMVALLALGVSFVVLLVSGLPIAFNLMISSMVYLLVGGYPLTVVAQRMFEGMNSFALLAVPFFVLTGQFMVKGHLLKALTDFVNSFFGHVRGALALVTIGTCLFMGAIVGLAVAEIASLGSFLIPMMKEEGYKPAYAGAVMAAGSLLGPIMPPSVLMILYCIAVGKTSIAGLFLAAVVPAFLLAGMQMLLAYYIAQKRNYPSHSKSSWPERWTETKRALPALFLPVIILGGIFGRVFTVTEASVVAALYAFVLTFFVYREAKWSDLPGIFMETALQTGLVILLAGTATVTAWAIANEQIVLKLVAPLSNVPAWVFLLVVNILLLINGCFMDDYASVVVWGPIIAPIAWSLGVDPLHIGLIICLNLVVGLSTPPFGIALFVTAPMAGVTLEEEVKEIFPFILVSIAFLLIVTFVPQLSLFLPRLCGY